MIRRRYRTSPEPALRRQTGAVAQEAWVGLFVLAALLLAGYVTLRIAGSSLLEPGRPSYEVRLEASGGVRSGDTVRVAGVEVGRITDLQLGDDPERPVTLTVELDPNVRLGPESRAFIGSDSLLGGKYLAIDPGPPSDQRLEPGSSIEGDSMQTLERSLMRLETVADRAVGVLEETERLVRQLADRAGPILDGAEQLMGAENQANLSASLAGLRQALETLGPRLDTTLAQLESTAAGVETAAVAVPEVGADVSALSRDLRATLEHSLGPQGEELRQLLARAESALGRLDTTLSTVNGNRGDLEATLRDLRDASANLKTLSESLAARPSSLLGLRTPRERQPGDGVGAKESP